MYIYFSVLRLVPKDYGGRKKGDGAKNPSEEHGDHFGGCVVGCHGIIKRVLGIEWQWQQR